jgi:hypothetical protein
MSEQREVSRRRSRRRRAGPAHSGVARFRVLPRSIAALVVGAVVLSMLGLGAQQGPLLLAVSVLCVLAGALAYKAGGRVPHAAWACAALAGFTLVQAIPMPVGWLQSLSPQAFDVWSRALRAFGEAGPSRASLSLDPSATLVEALKWAAYAYLLVACAEVRVRWGSAWLAVSVFGSGVLLAALTLLHGAVDAESIYGFYTPSFAVDRWSRGPLLNSNNLAGYANLALFSGIALLRSPRNPLPKWSLALGGALLSTVVLLSASRAGILALFAGVLALFVLGAASRRRFPSAPWGAAALAMTAAFVVFTLLADERIYRAVMSADASQKVAVWKHTLSMIADYPVFGVGRGAFESAFSPYYEPVSGEFATVYAHAENFPIQFLSEWGMGVGGLALSVGLIVFARIAWQRRGDPVAVTLAVGVAVLLLQNLADLALEIPAVMIALVVTWSALSHRAPSGEARPALGGVAFGVPGIAAVALAVAPAFHGVQEERAAITERLRTADLKLESAREELRGQLRAASLRHPAEPFFSFVAALVSYRARDMDPLPALGRALERAPYSGQVHLLLSHVLTRKGARSQALLHLRLAARYDRTLRAAVIERSVAWTKTGEELVGVLPQESEAFAQACPKVPLSERRVGCWEAFERLSPGEVGKVAETWLALLEAKLSPCDGAQRATCERSAEAEIAALKGKHHPPERLAPLEARLKVLRGDTASAIRELLAGCPETNSALPCHELAIRLARDARATEALVTAVSRWLPLVCAHDAAACPRHKSEAGRWLGEAGAWGLALRHFTESATSEPTASRWLDVAETAIRLRNPVTARVALDRGRSLASSAEAGRVAELERQLLDADGAVRPTSSSR